MANQPQIKKKEDVVEDKKQRNQLSKKKEEAGNGSEQRDNGWIHVLHVHDATHLAVTTTAGQQTLMNYPTQRKTEWSH